MQSATGSGEGVCAKPWPSAKNDRINAELIARFFTFRPEAGRSLPAEKLRLLRVLPT